MTLIRSQSSNVSAAPLQALAKGAMFWFPDNVVSSVWLEHMPLIFWLQEVIRPSLCVTLGISAGGPHPAFCQGVSRLDLDSHCLLVGENESDELEDIETFVNRRYSTVAHQVTFSLKDSAKQLSERSIDILAVDTALDEAALKELIDIWLPKLSDKSIVLIPGLNRRDKGNAAHRVFDDLSKNYRSFSMPNGSGLGVVCVGSEPSALVQTLLDRWRLPSASRMIKEVFARLGAACFNQALAEERRSEVRYLKRQLNKLESSQAASSDHQAQLNPQALSKEEGERDELLHPVHNPIYDELEAEKSEKLALQERVEWLQAERNREKAEFDSKTASIQHLESKVAELKRREDQLEAEKNEKLALQERVEWLQAEREREKAEFDSKVAPIQHLEGEAEEFKRRVDELEADLADREQEVSDLLKQDSEKAKEKSKLLAILSNLKDKVKENESTLTKWKAERQRKDEQIEKIESSHRNNEKKWAERLKSNSEEWQKQIREKDVELLKRFEEIALLTQMVEKHEHRINTSEEIDEDPQQTEARDVDGQQEELADSYAGADASKADDVDSSSKSDSREPTNAQVQVPTAKTTKHSGLFGGLDRRKKRKLERQEREQDYVVIVNSGWFDQEWYLAQYPDVAKDERFSKYPALHYLKFGGFEGRDPSPNFSSEGYLRRYPDVAAQGVNPLLHFLRNKER